MIGATEQRALELARRGRVTKYDIPHCDQRTAQRALKRLHEGGQVHIAEWVPMYHQKIPAYAAGPGRDKPKPRPVTNTERSRRRRRDSPELCMKEAAKKRAKRFKEQQQRLILLNA